jgi:hypothetical protein
MSDAPPTDSQGRTAFKYLPKGEAVWFHFRSDKWTTYEGHEGLPMADALAGRVTTIRMAPAASIEGVLVTETGGPIPNRRIVFQSELGMSNLDRETHTDREGRFRMRGLARGTCYIAFAWGDVDTYGVVEGTPYVEPDSVTTTLRVGEVRRGLKIIARRGSEVRGRVLHSATGRPLSNCRVGLVPQGSDCGMQSHTGITDQNGLYHFRARPGAWFVDVSASDGYAEQERWAIPGLPKLTTKQGMDVDLGDVRVTIKSY